MAANLKNLSRPTPEEARKLGAAGGRKSGIAKRKKKNLKAACEMFLSLPASMKGQKALKKAGLESDELTIAAEIIFAVIQKAKEGDVRAASFIADLVGEGAGYDLKRKELQMKREAAKALKARNSESSSAMQLLVDSLNKAWEEDGRASGEQI